MIKRVLPMTLLVAFALSLCLTASARWENSHQCVAALTFSNKTATCSAIITATEPNAKITASISLYRVNSNGSLSSCMTWPSKTGTGKLSLSGYYSHAVSGNTYRLVISGAVKDSSGSHSISTYRQAKCP